MDTNIYDWKVQWWVTFKHNDIDKIVRKKI